MNSLVSLILLGIAAGIIGAVLNALICYLVVALFKRFLGETIGKIVLYLAYGYVLFPLLVFMIPVFDKDFWKAFVIAPLLILFSVAMVVGSISAVFILRFFSRRDILGLATRSDRVVHSSK
ncbi:hypothetical protein [Roseibium denhamense]|uniref:Uncharacterized protein n=1 Tax=Roseibium denhamense TaxID=76305 RepID=A0ABY1PQN0_9HYPH|nr:hypothetical protein [Roseibium denhamense]SMP37300.1 hypothetical protein SAMN06265374_0048 [Roseibium denhamense]